MENRIEWCKFFADIESNPTAIVPRMTVREFLQAREHIYGCDNCNNRVERVLARAPKPKFPNVGEN